MSERFTQHGIARSAAFLAALALVLPPLGGQACACAVKGDQQSPCSHCSRRTKNTSNQPAKACCSKRQVSQRHGCCQRRASATQIGLNDQCAGTSVCHCRHDQRPETPVGPVGQSQLSVDQLLLALGSVSTPLVPGSLAASAASSACQNLCMRADTSLERCVLLSRMTL
jgi:hypothetical protein